MFDCSGGGGGLLLHHPPPTLSGGGGRSRGGGAGAGGGTLRPTALHLVDEGLDGGELLRQVTQVGLEGVELLVQVVQSLRQRLDPEGEKPQRVQVEFTQRPVEYIIPDTLGGSLQPPQESGLVPRPRNKLCFGSR